MKLENLTALCGAATPAPTRGVEALRNSGLRIGMAGLLASALAGCINVAAPEEPIVIELNINIRQEVIYRLADDAADAIEENADIF